MVIYTTLTRLQDNLRLNGELRAALESLVLCCFMTSAVGIASCEVNKGLYSNLTCPPMVPNLMDCQCLVTRADADDHNLHATSWQLDSIFLLA